MDNEYVKREELESDKYFNLLNSSWKWNQKLFSLASNVGGIKRDVLDFLLQNEIGAEEERKLEFVVKNNLSLDWLFLVLDVMQKDNEIAEGNNAWYDELMNCYRLKVPEKIIKEILENENITTPHRFQNAVNEYISSNSTENISTEAIEDIQKCMSGMKVVIESMEDKQDEHSVNIAKYEKILEAKDNEIKELQKRVSFYEVANEEKAEKIIEQQARLSELNITINQLKKANVNEDFVSVAMKMLQRVLKTSEETNEKISNTKVAFNSIMESQNSLMDEMAKGFQNQQKYFEQYNEKMTPAFFEESEENEEPTDFSDSSETDEYQGYDDSFEPDEEEYDVPEGVDIDELEEQYLKDIQNKEDPEKVEELEIEEQPTVEYKSKAIQGQKFDKKELDDKKIKAVSFFEKVKKKILMRKFQTKKDKEKQQMIIGLVMERDYQRKILPLLDKAFKKKTPSLEFMYQLLIDKRLTYEEFQEVLVIE